MKRTVLLTVMALCMSVAAYGQTGTHYTDGPIVDQMKKAVAAYNAGDWDTYRAIFADTARIHVNSPEPISLDERMAQLKEGAKMMDSYALVEPVYGHIRTAEGEDWGMIWSGWQGTAGDTEITVIVHTVTRFVDGKAVVQWGFWDSSQAPTQMEGE